MLSRLIYSSAATGQVWLKVAEDIVLTSLRNNLRLGITGCLCASDREYLQVLEGEDAAIEAIYASIEKDERHHHVHVSQRCAIESRDFASWAMGLAPRLPEYEPVFQRHMTEGTLRFADLAAEAQLELLLDLRQVAQRHTRGILHLGAQASL